MTQKEAAKILSKAYRYFNNAKIVSYLPQGVTFRRDSNAGESFFLYLAKRENTSRDYCIYFCSTDESAAAPYHLEEGFKGIIDGFLSKIAGEIEAHEARETIAINNVLLKEAIAREKDLQILREIYK